EIQFPVGYDAAYSWLINMPPVSARRVRRQWVSSFPWRSVVLPTRATYFGGAHPCHHREQVRRTEVTRQPWSRRVPMQRTHWQGPRKPCKQYVPCKTRHAKWRLATIILGWIRTIPASNYRMSPTVCN